MNLSRKEGKMMTDKEKAKRHDALMTAIDFTRKSIAARSEVEMIEVQTCHVQDIPMDELFVFPYDRFGVGNSESKLKPYNYAICVKRLVKNTYRVDTIGYLDDEKTCGWIINPFADEVIRTGVHYGEVSEN